MSTLPTLPTKARPAARSRARSAMEFTALTPVGNSSGEQVQAPRGSLTSRLSNIAQSPQGQPALARRKHVASRANLEHPSPLESALVLAETDSDRINLLSAPKAGRSLTAEVEARAAHVRRAVQALRSACRQPSLIERYRAIFDPRALNLERFAKADPFDLRTAWALVSMWLVGRCLGAIGESEGLREAEEWFLGDLEQLPALARSLSRDVRKDAERELQRLTVDTGLDDLLPYILEHHGIGTRLSVMRDPATRQARDAKRRHGVFYTPSDVAEFMVRTTLDAVDGASQRPHCFDPACGTGVFLLALVRTARSTNKRDWSFDPLTFVENSIYGADISPLAVQAATFALLHEVGLSPASRSRSPWSIWHAIRLNLAATNSLYLSNMVDEFLVNSEGLSKIRSEIRRSLRDGRIAVLPSGKEPDDVTSETLPLWRQCQSSTPLMSLFPELRDGFDIIVGNPPYTQLSDNADELQHVPNYASLVDSTPKGTNGVYPLFIEIMWRLAKAQQNASALVVPLSIAYHQGRQYRACRRAMQNSGGSWRCAFFDREPHGLFGEEVKTRNAILFRRQLPSDPQPVKEASISSTPLLKWTSRTRPILFSTIRFTDLGSFDFEPGIPKLDGIDQATTYLRLSRRKARLSHLVVAAHPSPQSDACTPSEEPRVFVGSTAYTFINVFRAIPDTLRDQLNWSRNPVLCLRFRDDRDAQIAFAVLASRLAFWLWHASGDGFHVHKSFILSLPFDKTSFSASQQRELCKRGEELWNGLGHHYVLSCNKGRHTVAFRSLVCQRERDAIDRILVIAAGLPETFLEVLRCFERKTVIVDERDERRHHLARLFRPQGNNA